jgi:hypothetical protein
MSAQPNRNRVRLVFTAAGMVLAATAARAHPGHGLEADPQGPLHYLGSHGIGLGALLLAAAVVAARWARGRREPGR